MHNINTLCRDNNNKTLVMTSKILHYVKKFVMTSKLHHNVKNT